VQPPLPPCDADGDGETLRDGDTDGDGEVLRDGHTDGEGETLRDGDTDGDGEMDGEADGETEGDTVGDVELWLGWLPQTWVVPSNSTMLLTVTGVALTAVGMPWNDQSFV